MAAAAVLASGCVAEPELYVDLVTDVVPGQEFTAARVEIHGAGEDSEPTFEDLVPARAGTDFIGGQRLAEVALASDGVVPIRVALLDAAGDELVDRWVRVAVRGPTGVTVLITRSCVDVTCPGPEEPDALSTCLANRCVDPRCTPQTPEHCGNPQCLADADCGGGSECSAARCIEGACLQVETETCPAPSYCDPSLGCVDAPTSEDSTPDILAAGRDFSCSVQGGEALCWGTNNGGQIGSAPDPTLIPHPVEGLQNVTGVYAYHAASYACATDSDGGLVCWGPSPLHETDATPLDVAGLPPVRDVAAGLRHVCVAGSDGSVHCAGQNPRGQLGVASTAGAAIEMHAVALSGVMGVSAGHDFSCATIDGGDVYCWGDNQNGQIGTAPDSLIHAPTAVSIPAGVVEISSGQFHSCAVSESGRVWCWGNATNYRAGVDPPISTGILTGPTDIGLANVVDVEAGLDTTCVTHGNGTVTCFGFAADGLLGPGTEMLVIAGPTPFAGMQGVSEMAIGRHHACGLADGNVLCWGTGSGLGPSSSEVMTTFVPLPVF